MTFMITQSSWTTYSLLYFLIMVLLYPLTKPYKVFDWIFVLGASYLLITGFINQIT